MSWQVVSSRPAGKIWVVLGPGWRVRLPAVARAWRMAQCWLLRHDWGRWRIETEDWWEWAPGPIPYAWRACRRCHATEQVRPRRQT